MSIYGVSGGKTVAYNKVYTIENGVTKKMGKGYVIENGKTKKIYSGNPFGGYTGNYTTSEITKNGVLYTLYTMTGSGTLTLNDDVEYWMCGGGAGGMSAYTVGESNTTYYHSGNGGGGGYVQSGTLKSGTHVVTIGAGGSKDSNGADTQIVGNATITATGGECTGNGASGGGGNGTIVWGHIRLTIEDSTNHEGFLGQGVSTIPFDLSTLNAHSAGGGAGGFYFSFENTSIYAEAEIQGGAGGSNGSNGSSAIVNFEYGADGGDKGGGRGGLYKGVYGSDRYNAGAASFYGSAGGGGALYRYFDNTTEEGSDSTNCGNGGKGYQGVLYLLIPA